MNTVETAQARASISAFLANHPGWHYSEEVAKSTELSSRTAGLLMAAMSKQGLISPPRTKANRKQWRWQPEAEAPAVPPAPKPSNTGKAGARDEVELVVNGRVILIGTNEITGRLRIVLNT